jgi:uncharacterized protein
MQERDLGGQHQNGPVGTGGPGSMSAQDERTWSIVAHLSVLAALVGLMPLGALVVWLIYKDRSPVVRFHAAQALWYQVAWIVILIAYTIVSLVLSIVVIGIFMFFLLPILALVPLVHGCYAAYKVSQGVDYRYPYIADKVDGGARRAF